MQTKKKVETMLLVLDFNRNNSIYTFEIIEVEENRETHNLNDFYNIIGCNTVDITDYSDDIAIIVDDEGLFKENTFITEIIAPDGYHLQLAGKLIFAKNVYTEDSTKIGGLSSGECFNLITNLKMRLMGVKR